MHEGHRQRLLGKLKNGDNLYEHELLEILLFNAYPRKDVNPIAHELLNRFASIKEICSADIDEICTVNGVGVNTALYLKCIGRCMELRNDCESFAVIKNTAEFKVFITSRFQGKGSEVLELYLLDKNGRVKRICSFTSNDVERVDVNPDEIIKLISVHRPYGLYMAHNHVDYVSNPSPADDRITKQVQIICRLNNVKLFDHCIYSSPTDIYSYFVSGKIDAIKAETDIEKLL